MATRGGGAKPGERRGGRKPGTPNGRVTPRDVATLARVRAIQEELSTHHPPKGVELSKEILGRFAHNCAAMAIRMMPTFNEAGEPQFRFPQHHKLWKEMMDLTFKFANGASPFQSPTFRAIMIAPGEVNKVPGDDAMVIDLKIFENTGTAVALLDEMAGKAKRG